MACFRECNLMYGMILQQTNIEKKNKTHNLKSLSFRNESSTLAHTCSCSQGSTITITIIITNVMMQHHQLITQTDLVTHISFSFLHPHYVQLCPYYHNVEHSS